MKRYYITIFITVPIQVRSITSANNPLQSGSVFYKQTKPTGVLYKHRQGTELYLQRKIVKQNVVEIAYLSSMSIKLSGIPDVKMFLMGGFHIEPPLNN